MAQVPMEHPDARRRVITLWPDLRDEMDHLIAQCAQCKAIQLNLLRRSILAWRRYAKSDSSPEMVSLIPEDLDELESELGSAHEMEVRFGSGTAMEHLQKAKAVIERYNHQVPPG